MAALNTGSSRMGGYDEELFVDQNAAGEFLCVVCLQVAREAHQTGCCGRMFCESCIKALKRKSNSFQCPTCRKYLRDNHFPDKMSRRRINSLCVYCTNRVNGCSWTGELQDINTHLATKCIVDCPKDCGELLQYVHLKHHVDNKCINRIVQCTYCDSVGKSKYIDGYHKDKECQYVPVPCSNPDCKKKLQRGCLGKHLAVCPKQVVQCKYVGICNEVMKREDEANHYSSCMEKHLESAWLKLKDVDERQISMHDSLKEFDEKLLFISTIFAVAIAFVLLLNVQ